MAEHESGMTPNSTYRSTCAQVLACLAFNCLSINLGFIISMPVIIIGALRLNDPTLQFSEEQASWFGGLIFIIQPMGSLVSGFLQDTLGRKTCMMMVNIPQLVAWIMMYYASSVTVLFVSSIILGISIGFVEAPVLSYVGEISEPRLRGILSTFGGIFFHIGMLLQMLIAALVDWRTMALIDAIGPVVAFIALALVPESPAWQVTKGRMKDAQRTFQWLRGWVSPQAVQEELDNLVKYVQGRSQDKVTVNKSLYTAVSGSEEGLPVSENAEPPQSQLQIFLHPSIQRPMRLIVLFFIISTCASLSAMRPFIIEFLEKLELPVDSHWLLVVINCLTLLGSVTSTLTLRFVGKRGLTFMSLSLAVVCCFGLGVYLSLGVHVPWVPLVLFAVSFYSVPLGIICVPWFLITELFPLRGRGLATGVSGALAYIIIFLVVKTYYSVVTLLTVAGACFFYGTIGLLGFVYLYFQLPETEGVPLEVIERIFADKPRRNLHE